MSAGKVPEAQTERDRKLLLKKNEINKIKTLLKNIGYTLVVSQLFLANSGFIKVEVVVSKGLKKYEKRERKKEKDLKRKLEADRKYYG
ncbi:MAG: hypothetical protein KatS3mg085_319 [Candidatus Dojkabacteria bacterium]|nr:MAG: hypothetical protein KatS3mg085_319 [Candidatus Dojkabacteria bacterium]